METKCHTPKPNVLCVNVEQVYDWVVQGGCLTTEVPISCQCFETQVPPDVRNPKVKCILTDKYGNPLPLNTKVDATEVCPREDHRYEVEGSTVVLQKVTFQKKLYVKLIVSWTEPECANQVQILSRPIPLTFVETAFLCAPPGTSLVVRVSGFTCQSTVFRDKIRISVFVCQSIQTVAPVTVEMTTNFCTPRESWVDRCGLPTVPPTCPSVFPNS